MEHIPREILLAILSEVHPYYSRLHMTNSYFRYECHNLRYIILKLWCGNSHANTNLKNLTCSDVRFASLFYCPIPESKDRFSIYSLFHNYYSNTYYQSTNTPVYLWMVNNMRILSRHFLSKHVLHQILTPIFILYRYSNINKLRNYMNSMSTVFHKGSVQSDLIDYVGIILGFKRDNNYNYLLSLILISFLFNNLILTSSQIISILLRMKQYHGDNSIPLNAIIDRLQCRYDNTYIEFPEYNNYYREASLILCRYGSYCTPNSNEVNKLLQEHELSPTFQLKPFRTSYSRYWRYNAFRIDENRIPTQLQGIYYVMRGKYVEFLNWKRTLTEYRLYLKNIYYNQHNDSSIWLTCDDTGNISYCGKLSYNIQILESPLDIIFPTVEPWNFDMQILYTATIKKT